MSEFLGSLIDLLQKAFQAFDEVHLPVCQTWQYSRFRLA
jgi:hypothetical protein